MNVHFFELEEKLMFHLDRSSGNDPKAEPFIFEGLATKRHIKEYPNQYKLFLESKNKPKIVKADVLKSETIAEMKEAAKPIVLSNPL